MESQEEEYKNSVWEIYRKEWAIAGPEKRANLEKRMLRWQELMKNGWSASQAYYRVMMEEDLGKAPSYSFRSWRRKAPLVILGLALVGAMVYGVVTTQDRNALNTELVSTQSVLASTESELESTKETLTSTQSELNSTQSELGSTKQTLVSTQSELSSTKQTLASTQVELISINDKLTSTQAEIGSLADNLTSTQIELSSTKQTFTSTQSELETVEAKLNLYKETTGIYDITSDVQPLYEKRGESLFSREYVYLTNGPVATNPTWRELKAFLLADPTDDETYSILNFHCANFAEMLHNNAEADSIKAAFVAVFFEGEEKGHALNAFKTSDKGLVYVDCGGRGLFQSQALEYDKIAYVMKGKEYGLISIDSAVSPKYSFYEQMGKSSGSGWEPLGIVERIEIYW